MAGKLLILLGKFDMIFSVSKEFTLGNQNNISELTEPGKFGVEGGVIGEYEQFIILAEQIQLEPSLNDWHRAHHAPAIKKRWWSHHLSVE